MSGIAPFTSSDPSSDHTSLTTTNTSSDTTSTLSFYDDRRNSQVCSKQTLQERILPCIFNVLVISSFDLHIKFQSAEILEARAREKRAIERQRLQDELSERA